MKRILAIVALCAAAWTVNDAHAMPIGVRTLMNGHAAVRQAAEVNPESAPDPTPTPTPDPEPTSDPTPDPIPDPTAPTDPEAPVNPAPVNPTPVDPTPGPTPTPTPDPDPQPDPEPEEVPGLYEEVDGVAPTDAASEYNGYLYDEKSGAVKGTIQVKVGKLGKKDGKASVKATVQLGAKKVTLKAKDKGKAVINPNGPTEIELVGGEACEIVLGAEGISGTYSKYFIDGARNFFTSKDKAEAGAANAALGKWLGAVNVVWDGGSVNIAIAKKGKAKVKGTLADGKTKISVNSVFLVGEEWCCVPVAAPKANLAFTVWMPSSGGNVVVDGLGDSVVAGKAGSLRLGSKFRIDGAAFTGVLPYLPDGVSVEQQGTKWGVAGGAKAGKVVYKDGMVDESKLGENPSGLKLSYKAKDGSFKGSFKVYAVDGSKVKATTVTITGVLVNGVGYGAATIKDKGSVAVTIE